MPHFNLGLKLGLKTRRSAGNKEKTGTFKSAADTITTTHREMRIPGKDFHFV